MIRTLADVEQALGPDALRVRIEAADREAADLDRVRERLATGCSRSAAIREAMPDRPLELTLRRLRMYEEGGRDALVSRRYGPPAPRKMTDEVRGGLRALATSDPTAGSEILAERLSAMFGTSIEATVVQKALRDLGLARPRGRPWWRTAGAVDPTAEPAPLVEALPLAGAELFKAVDQELGAVGAMTDAQEQQLAALPAPAVAPEDDRGDRDDHGRFLAGYNEPEARLEPELGDRFDSVEQRRRVKDLRAMRVVEESRDTHFRKNLGLVLLPVVVRSPRWSELRHWRGDLLESLVGFGYQPSTLDKYLRELKFAGVADASRDAVGSFWLGAHGEAMDAATGAIVLYADATTKPVWTHHWTRAAKVSKTGRVMPAVTTMTLHSGAGTPLLYRSVSGTSSLPKEILAFLKEYERHAGEGTVRRVIVMDREAHSIALFKALDPTWGFVIPLRSQVTGPSARFEDVGPWVPYGEGPDEVCDARLWLNDARKGEGPLSVRVVGRRRHRTGNVAWYATNLSLGEFSATHVVRIYFERWPAQEHVYRDGSGAVGLDVHHGYGKKKGDNVAVIDRQEKLLGQVRGLDTEIARLGLVIEELRDKIVEFQRAVDRAGPKIRADRDAFEAAIATGRVTQAARARYASVRAWESWFAETRVKIDGFVVALVEHQQAVAVAERDRAQKLLDVERLASQRRIFTVDVELDEIMTAYKLTFMNVCGVLMSKYMGVNFEIETLIDSVLTLPGERVTTATTETVRIFPSSRDLPAKAAVERACVALTARNLRRGNRRLTFEVAAVPPTSRR